MFIFFARRFMKTVAARQTRYRNRLDGRTGTLWESRFKSSLEDRDAYLLACQRYIELNPVRAKIVESPDDYQWSSYRNRVGSIRDDVVDIDPAYTALAETGERRSACYRRFVEGSITPGENKLIREVLQRGQLTGTQRFVDEVEAITRSAAKGETVWKIDLTP
jgi:REP-associated tyrosine transposase